MARKRTTEAEPYWTDLVQLYFSFCETNFNEKPSFDNSSPRDYKKLIESLRKRAIEKNIEWTKEIAVARVTKFLEYCYKDKFLGSNFIPMNLNRQKDKIFFQMQKDHQKSKSVYNFL